ncbi:MAG TPA: SelB C-terminal domain-containing protein, partial [Aggregatilineales bacterium]|nr:SelB C-terminal domain-containing protein [Aggregatilineales bacterium]
DAIIRHHNHEITVTDAQDKLIMKLLNAMYEAPFTPPTFSEGVAMIGEPLVQVLIDWGDIILISDEIILTKHTFVAFLDETLAQIEKNGQVDVKALRDKFNTTRKYIIPFFEYTDTLGYTKRVGDVRVKGDKA